MSHGFNTALTALTTAQRAMQIVGNNLANATTPGFSRQRVELDALAPTSNQGRLWIGRGVDITTISRVHDALLEGRLQTQESEVARQSAIRSHLVELETVFAEPGSNGLAGIMSSFFASISGLTAAPEDPALRTGVLQRATTVADTFRLLRRQLGDVQGSFEDETRVEVDRINNLAGEIANLNDSIVSSRQGPEIPAAFLDRQDQLLRELSQHLDIQFSREATGRVTVVSGSAVLVSPRGQIELSVASSENVDTGFEVRAIRGTTPFEPRNGRLRALLDLSKAGVPERIEAVDQLAKNFILEFNRVHSTGVPLEGGYRDLASTNFFRDVNGSGSPLDERLSDAGLPFDISSGALYVNVSDEATGAITRTRIDIDPTTMTVQGFRDAVNAIPNLSAVVDPIGRLRITSDAGYRFDFSNRVLPMENLGRSFGAAEATIVGGVSEPFFLNPGDSLGIAVDGGAAQTITFNAGQFTNIAQASATEVALAINTQLTGATAEVVDGRIVIRSNGIDSQSSLQISNLGGTPAAALGLSTALETGTANAVGVQVEGSYAGAETRAFAFRALSAGTIGVTNGLQVEVTDQTTGAVVATLNVGAGYEAGSAVNLVDGVSIRFGAGEISNTAGDRFEMTLVGDADTSDFLAATGTGSFFTGHDAGTIGVNRTLAADSSLLAAALSAAPGDNANLLRLQSVRESDAEGLDGSSINDFYLNMISELGGESERAAATLETQELVRDSLSARREAISGVNIDEELLLMEQFQQTYRVAARFLQVMQEVDDILLSL